MSTDIATVADITNETSGAIIVFGPPARLGADVLLLPEGYAPPGSRLAPLQRRRILVSRERGSRDRKQRHPRGNPDQRKSPASRQCAIEPIDVAATLHDDTLPNPFPSISFCSDARPVRG